MSNSLDDESSFLKDSSVIFMTALLADVKKGTIQLPRFQRGNRWTLQQRLELLDRVNKGIPIGAIMVWRTKARLAAQEKIVRDVAPTHWLPLPDALQTVALLKFQRKLQGPTADVNEWVARADAVATRFRSYKVSVILLGSEDIELATTTFKRVNSTGTRMSDLDMVNALVWSPTFDLAETLLRQREEVLAPLGWEDLEDETWLRCIKAALHLDLYASADDVRKSLQQDGGAIDRTVESSRIKMVDFG